MNLKKLRLSKNLNQEQCAKYLGVSLRTYKSYENDKNKEKTYKYEDLVNKLNSYMESMNININNTNIYYTNVIIGEGINRLHTGVKKYKKRDCYQSLKKYIFGEYNGKLCALYGLRRTGKTTLIFQMLGELPTNKCAYIKIKTTDNMSNLTKDLDKLNNQGYKYIFIDEITLLNDFINTAAILSDLFCSMGIKIVCSGTDSLGFMMASRDELYDRSILIHTSFISFKEYERLLNIKSIDKYIEYGGTLRLENMSFDDKDSTSDEVSFKDDESTRKYIDSSISKNIQHTLKNDNFGEYFNQLKEVYDKGELTNAINRIVENMNHNFLLSVIEEEFKSHDFGSAKNLLLHDAPKNTAYILDKIDVKSMLTRLKKIAEIKEKEETSIKLTQEHIDKIKKYLISLDLIVNCKDVYETGSNVDHYIFTQPGMRFSLAKALVYALMQDNYFKSNSEADKEYIKNKILEDVKGKMLEEIVLLETNLSKNKALKAFKFKFDNGGEYDMVIYNADTNTCSIYEIKHSDKIVEKQYRYLLDKNRNKIIENIYGDIKERIVLYRGINKTLSNSIKYINVEKYLMDL